MAACPRTTLRASAASRVAVAAVALVALLGGCSGDDAEAVPSPPATDESTPTRPDGELAVPPPLTDPVAASALADARTDLAPIVARVQVQPAVADCLYHSAATAPGLTDGVDVEDPATWAPVLDAVARCTHAIVAAPAFAEEQQRSAGGALTDDQLACLRDGYAGLSPEQVQAVTEHALSPGTDASDHEEVEAIIERCDVDRGH